MIKSLVVIRCRTCQQLLGMPDPMSIGPWIQTSSEAYFCYSSSLFNALDWVDMEYVENWSAPMMIQIILEGKDQKITCLKNMQEANRLKER